MNDSGIFCVLMTSFNLRIVVNRVAKGVKRTHYSCDNTNHQSFNSLPNLLTPTPNISIYPCRAYLKTAFLKRLSVQVIIASLKQPLHNHPNYSKANKDVSVNLR